MCGMNTDDKNVTDGGRESGKEGKREKGKKGTPKKWVDCWKW